MRREKSSYKNILIVEDEPATLNALVDKFIREKFRVLEAVDGEAGLTVALEEHPDLILLDLVLPKMDGISMLQKLRGDAWGKTVPVMILTNLSDNENVAEAIAQGSHEYLVKSDWKIEDVVNKVKDRLGIE